MAETNQEFLNRQFSEPAVSPNAAFLNELFDAPTPVKPPVRVAKDIADALTVGGQNSATGLALRGKLPDIALPENAPWYHRALSGAANVGSDILLSAAGIVVGGAAGAAVGTIGVPVPGLGTAVGGTVGAGAGAFAVPMAIREALVTAYNNKAASSWEGVLEIAAAALKGGAKGAAIGGLTGGAGMVAGRVAGAAIAPAVGTAVSGRVAAGAIETAAFGSELATLTTASSALEGHLPTWRDFMDNAILLGGMKSAIPVAKALRNTFAETGKLPEQVLADAARDPQIKADLEKLPEPQKLYHGGDTLIIEIDYTKLQSRDSGFYGKGFYLSETPEATKGYGGVVSEFYLSPSAKVLRAGLTQDMAPPGLVDKVAQWVYDSGIERVKARGKEAAFQEEIAMIKTDISTWNNAVDRYAEAHGYDAVRYAPSEIVVKNLDVLRTTKPVVTVPRAYAPLALEQRIQAAMDKDNKPEILKAITAIAKGEPIETKGDLIRYEYLNSDEAVKGVIRLVAEANKEQVELQRRGVVPTAASIADGKLLLAEGDLARHVRGEADAPYVAAARAMLVNDAAVRAKRLATELNDTPIAERSTMQKMEAMAAVEQVGLFYGELAGGVAEAARTLQLMGQLKRNPELLGEAEMMLKMYEKKGKNIGELAGLIANMKDPAQMAQFMVGLSKASTLEKVIEVFRANIFSGMRTHEANLMGNYTKWLVDIPEAMFSTTWYAGARALQGDPLKMAQFKARAFAPLIGMQLGAWDGVKAAVEVFRQQEAHLEKVEVMKLANEGAVGAYTGTVFRILQAEDMLVRIPGERAQAYIMAVDRVVREGFNPDTADGRALIEKYRNNPELGLTEKHAQEATAEIYKAGATAAFSERLGPRFEKIQQAIAGSWGQLIVSAFRTPVNLASYAIQHSPGINFLSARWWNDFNAGGERQAKAIARVVVGAGLYSLAYGLFKEGMITGSGLYDPEMRLTKEGAGIPKNSVKVGNEYYNIERIEPVSKPLLLAANLMELMDVVKDKGDKAKIAIMGILAFANTTVSTTYLSALANTMRAVMEPNRAAEAFVESYASAIVPKVIGQTVETADPYKREVEGALDAIHSQLPFFREKLLAKRDVWGEKLKNERLFAVLPISTSKESQDKVKSEAVRLKFAIADVPKYMTEKGPFNAKDRRTDLEIEQRDILKEVRGKEAMAFLAPIVNDPDWKSLPDFVQANIYKNALKKATKIGTFEALPPETAARMIVQEEIINKMDKQLDEADQR